MNTHQSRAAVIYCRVSTDRQEEDGTSLETQAEACQKYAEQHGYSVLEVFKESRSGATLNRPMLDKVRGLVREGAVGAVIFYALDRLSRDETDTLILAREFRTRGVELKCATTPLEDTPQGQFLLTMLAAVGKLERAGILERTQRGRRQSIKNGKAGTGHFAPLGYDYIEGEGKLVVNEAEAVWVRRVFDWYVNDRLSFMSIARRLRDQGVPTKRGGYWAPPTVRFIIINETYMGELWYGKTTTRNGKRVQLPREEWVGPVHVPPLISRDVFEAAQRQVKHNGELCTRNSKVEYLLRSRLFCSECGRRMTGKSMPPRPASRRYKRVAYYECCGKPSHMLGKANCRSRTLNRDRAEEKVWAWVVEHLSNPDLILELIRQPGEAERRQWARDDADMKALLGLRRDLDAEEDKLIELYTHSAISLPKFQERKSTLDERRAGVETAVAEIEERQAQRRLAAENIRAVEELCIAVQRGLPLLTEDLSLKEKQAVLQALRVKATANEDSTITVTGIVSEDLLALMRTDAEECDLSKEERNLLYG